MKRRAILLVLATAGLLGAESATEERLNASVALLQEMMNAGDNSIPQSLLDKSECAVLIPGMKKGAFIFGAKYGRGFIACRKSDGVGWIGPGAVRIEGGSFGLQIGGSETDVILLVMNPRGAQRLLSSQFKLGGQASVAAGPVGRTATAETDAYMTAEILSWSRSRGVFAGLSLDGSTLRQDEDVNKDVFGRKVTNKEIIEKPLPAPKLAEPLLSLLNRYSSRKGR